MSKYNFYYDESEHSKKINHRTIIADNYSDNFITVVVGWLSEQQVELYAEYTKFEEKYRHRQSNGELKSTAIRTSQLKNGFASLSTDTLLLLEDFLALIDENTFLYYSATSKIEYIIHQLFESYKNSFFMDMDAMKYSITKAIIKYQPSDIIAGVYGNTDELVTLLKIFLSSQIEKNKKNESLKQQEIEQFSQMLVILNDISAIKTINWDYKTSFEGFKKYLIEQGIHAYSLTIDKEGYNSNTAKAAQNVGLCDVSEADSSTSCGIRIADMFAGIISKLLKSLHNALRYISPEEQQSKKILDKSWFMINERQLVLYKKMYHVAVELNKSWHKIYGGIYSDDLILLVSFLGFMNNFESVEVIKKDIDMQGKYFNVYACENLANYYTLMGNKLPIDFVGGTAKDHFLNRQGAKVYFDTNKQSLLKIKSQHICDVLSVGFSKDMIPMITIKEKSNVKCYRIPTELSEWATAMVSFASMGESLFPSKVMFSKTKDGYFTDIL